jgi:hypothetical protein
MRIENLIQFIVPLTFLAIWALTSLFNREAQPLPPRSGRMPGPVGPRPGLGQQPVRAPAERRQEPFARPNMQPQEPQRRPTQQRTTRPSDDDILIIESDPRRPSSGTARITSPNVRRTGRGREKAAAAPKRTEPTTQRTLASSMTSQNSIASEVAQPRNLSALTLPTSPLFTPGPIDLPIAEALKGRDSDRDPFSAGDFRVLINSRARLRESLIMNEILQPPLALRGTGFRRP